MANLRTLVFATSAAAAGAKQLSERLKLRGGGALSDEPSINYMETLPARGLASCVSSVWHIDHTRTEGHWCSNALDYPQSWDAAPNMIHHSAEECCEFFFTSKGIECLINAVCDEAEGAAPVEEPTSSSPTVKATLKPDAAPTTLPIATPNPTMKPSPNPTSKPINPTMKPTSRPTIRPSPKPTTNPTKAPLYSIPSTGMCAPVDETTPAWITTFYTDWTECCKAGWQFEKCMKEAPSDKTETVSTSTKAPSILFYAIPTSGLCAPVDASTPSWMTQSDFFPDYNECCKSSWNKETCIAAKPDNLPTFQPSVQPTPTPPTASPSIMIIPLATMAPPETTTEATEVPETTTEAPDTTKLPVITTKITTVSPKTTTKAPISIPDTQCESALWHPNADFTKCVNR